MKPWCVTIQMKPNGQYFHVVLFEKCNLGFYLILSFDTLGSERVKSCKCGEVEK